MKFLIILMPLLVLLGCGKADDNNNKEKDKSVVKTGIVETLSSQQINNVCGRGTREMSIIGAWKLAAREVDGIYPELLVDFDFHDNGKVEIGLACKVSQEAVRATYNHKMVQTDYVLEGDMIMFSHHEPIVLTEKDDGVNCRLDDIAGTYKVSMQGECFSIKLTGQTIHMVRD